jgi:hypothetical protein
MSKIIMIIIIVSTVWSVISGLIEKHKREKLASQGGDSSRRSQLKQQNLRVSTQPQTLAELFETRINALRQKPPARVVVPKPEIVKSAQEPGDTRIKSIKSLHKIDCPLPPKQRVRRPELRAGAFYRILKTPHGIRTAVVLSEVLGKPVSQR